MHEPKLRRLRESGAVVLSHPCNVCGGLATYGRGVQLGRVARYLEKGEKPQREWLGVWTCGPDGCVA